MFNSKISNCHKKIFHINKIFLLQFFLNTFKVTLQYIFNVFIPFNTVFNLKLNFKLKIHPKMHTFKSLEKFEKKNNVNPDLCIETYTRASQNHFLNRPLTEI